MKKPANNRVEISECGKHRFLLHAKIPSALKWIKPMVFIMINPSTADAVFDDRTVMKCKKIAAYHRCTDLYIINLFSYRTKDVDELQAYLSGLSLEEFENICSDNMDWIEHVLLDKARNGKIIAAWGQWDKTSFSKDMAEQIMKICPTMLCMGKNKDGSPPHPLFLSAETILQEYLPHG